MVSKPKPNPAEILQLPRSLLDIVPSADPMFAEIFPGLAKGLKELAAELDGVRRGGGALKLARAFVVLHRIEETFKLFAGSTGVSGLITPYKSEHMPKAYEDEGVNKTLALDEGYRVTVSASMKVSLPAENREKGFEWLRENNLGDLITETVNAQTLTSTANTLLEEQGLELPGDIFSVHMVNNTSVTKIAPSKKTK